LSQDVEFLTKNELMDYSLLLVFIKFNRHEDPSNLKRLYSIRIKKDEEARDANVEII